MVDFLKNLLLIQRKINFEKSKRKRDMRHVRLTAFAFNSHYWRFINNLHTDSETSLLRLTSHASLTRSRITAG